MWLFNCIGTVNFSFGFGVFGLFFYSCSLVISDAFEKKDWLLFFHFEIYYNISIVHRSLPCHWCINLVLVISATQKVFSVISLILMVTCNTHSTVSQKLNRVFGIFCYWRTQKNKKFSFYGKGVCFYDTEHYHICVFLLHSLSPLHFW